jgi:hypothetical protein
MKQQSKVLVPNFFGEGEHLHANQLGWRKIDRQEAKSSVSKNIFNYFIEELGRNMIFYHIDSKAFYGIHAEICPTPIFRFKDLNSKYVYDKLGSQDTHDFRDGQVLYWIDKNHDVWDSVLIDGKRLEEVIQNSFIVNIN